MNEGPNNAVGIGEEAVWVNGVTVWSAECVGTKSAEVSTYCEAVGVEGEVMGAKAVEVWTAE